MRTIEGRAVSVGIKFILYSAAAMMAAPTTANAATLLASYVPANTAGSAFSFIVEEQPKPDYFDQFGFTVKIQNATGSISNRSDIQFFSQSYFGGISGFSGPQIYIGSISAPKIVVGEYALFGAFGNAGILTIAPSSVVPESSTWTMLIVGFGLVGAAMRYRRRATKIAYA